MAIDLHACHYLSQHGLCSLSLHRVLYVMRSTVQVAWFSQKNCRDSQSSLTERRLKKSFLFCNTNVFYTEVMGLAIGLCFRYVLKVCFGVRYRARHRACEHTYGSPSSQRTSSVTLEREECQIMCIVVDNKHYIHRSASQCCRLLH